MRPRLDWLLALVPVAIVLDVIGAGSTTIFVTSALAIVPLAGVIGRETEDIAAQMGREPGAF
ncbi:MAG: hypothetical protein M3290_01235 [Actinomycetota bacterium]|nr:hypothetical protein [Actinomycetota bacterium]